MDLARKRKCRVAFLEVRVSNRRAFNLYHGMGFNEIAVRKRYYPARGGRREHALVLAKVLDQE
jgi:ribosomal-protein-alanine N-acetyltransferase